MAQEYARAGLFTDCFPLLAQIADLPASQRSFVQQDALAAVTAAVGRQLASRPAKERHDLLKTWTLPEANRKAVRLLAAFVPVEAPPESPETIYAEFAAGLFPACNLPTGLGKTAAIPIWLIALANRPEAVPDPSCK